MGSNPCVKLVWTLITGCGSSWFLISRLTGENLKKLVKLMPTQPSVDLEVLFAAGVHFGHTTSRWHPKMGPYIHSKRGGRYLIDLAQTIPRLQTATEAVTKVVADGQQVLFVGTKRQAKEIVRSAAEAVGMPYATERWMGGFLTNHKTIGVQVKRLKDLETRMESGEIANKYSKLEVQKTQKRIDGLNLVYGGIKNLDGLPGLVFMVDMFGDAIAVAEANKLKIPIVGLVDTNIDPRLATYPIPANDDAIKSLQIITEFIQAAVVAGQAQRAANLPPKTAAGPQVIDPSPDDDPKAPLAPVSGVLG